MLVQGSGFRKEAFALLMKLDQRREKERGQGETIKTPNPSSTVPKEARNLFFDVNFKDGEPRSKILAERLTTMVDKLVNKHQIAFIKGKQIMDAALIASECIYSRMRGGSPGILCKLHPKSL